MDKKEDSRVTRSKRDLRNAFMELIKTQPFEKISVTDICKTAMINKMTFYKHYQDKYDLLDDCVKSVAESIYYACVPDADIERRLNENPAELFADLLSNAFQVCYKKREILLSLVYGKNTSLRFVVENCCKQIVEQLMKRLSQKFELKYPLSTTTAFITGGFANVITECIVVTDLSIEKFNGYARQFFDDILKSELLMK